uniref:Uncharacterized protein n=1 Tax=Ciona savignyi TaxID=51511 RepID=H2YU61_CIOSA
EEDFYRLKKKYKEKCQELEKQKRGFDALRKKCNDLQDALDERNELIETYRAKEAKSEHYERVIFDLKETVMWKDKKLEALVRQIDFY